MEADAEKVRAGLSEAEMKQNFVRLVFGGDERRAEAFRAAVLEAVPPDIAVVVRGSSATGTRWEDGSPFDALGPGTSDVDLTLVGKSSIDHFLPDEGFYIEDIHSKPLSDDHPHIAPSLVPLREKLTAMAGRPVNIQATRSWVMFVREHLMGQPYFVLIGKLETA